MATFATQDPQAGETDLGWSEAQTAAETRSRLASIIASLGSNDLLMFRGMYNHAGDRIMRTGITKLTIGAAQGCGLRITDTAANAGTQGDYFRFAGQNITISDLTVTSTAGFNQYKGLFYFNGGSNVTFEYCKLDADLKALVEFQSVSNLAVRRCEITNSNGWAEGRPGTAYSTSVLRTYGQCNNMYIGYNYFHDVPHEVIKTLKNPSSGLGPRMGTIEENFAKYAGRDFLDTTGGYNGTGPSARGIIRNNILVGMTLADLKFSGKAESDYPIGSTHSKYLSISGNKQFGGTNFIVTTMTDQSNLLTTTPGDRYWRDAITEDVLCDANELQDVTRLGLIKLGLNIRMNNTIKRGSTGSVSVYNQTQMDANGNTSPAVAEAVMAVHNSGNPAIWYETGTTTAASVSVPTTPSFVYGPRSGEAEPSSDPRHALVGSIARTNTDLGAMSATTMMAGVWNANGAASDSYSVTVS